MTFLLDVNALIALIDPRHIRHETAHEWFDEEGRSDWATCPLTQNGVIRIVGQPSYPNSLGTTGKVADLMARFCEVGRHSFWPDEISLLDRTLVDRRQLGGPQHVTDTYLLALAASRGGKLATFDRRLSTSAVSGGQEALHLIA